MDDTTTPSGSAMQKYLAIMISSINFLIKDGDALFVFDCFCYRLAGSRFYPFYI
jgi:hypothetical protein